MRGAEHGNLLATAGSGFDDWVVFGVYRRRPVPDALGSTPRRIAGLVSGWSVARWSLSYAEGKWTAAQIVLHLARPIPHPDLGTIYVGWIIRILAGHGLHHLGHLEAIAGR